MAPPQGVRETIEECEEDMGSEANTSATKKKDVVRCITFNGMKLDQEAGFGSIEDARTDNEDNVLVHEENEIIEHDAEVNMFGINNNVPFDNIDITIQLPWEVLAGGDVDMVHVDGFDSETGCEDEVGFKRRKKLKELIRGMENRVLNDIAGMKYSFYRR
nr:hypothetical protein [Tanacetum cinerariifolium]